MRKKTTPTLSLEEREALFDELEASLSPRPLLTVREQVGEPERPLYEYESDRTHKTPEEIDQEIEQMCAELLADCGKSPVSEHSQKKRCSNPYDEQPSSGKNADEPSELLQKPVNFGTPKHASPLVTTVLSKQFAMSETSILGKNPSNTLHTDQKPHTLLEGVQPKMFVFRSWRDTDDNHKLMLAVAPLLDRAAELSYECKAFTLILNSKLSKRLDQGDQTAPEQIRDQMVRKVREALGTAGWFLYAIEKTPAALSRDDSRRRWHLHGLMIGPAGFSAQGKTKLRRALRRIKGEADSDLMFTTPGSDIEREGFASALGWAAYCAKNKLSVRADSRLNEFYDLPAGKATYISSELLRRTKAHYQRTILIHANRNARKGT
ncbi:hypothetical protein [Stutzerimonas stutzeri]|uniref:hypothetical protein n=1 Tax=Stutzerimonas stutzeri TaxID=316 RepID=UPI0003777231|nr:hypothetical protein [Stutzerimonas stutzeri]